MSIEKGLQPEQGLLAAVDSMPETELALDLDATTEIRELDDGSIEFALVEGGLDEVDIEDLPFDANLAEYISEDDLNMLGAELLSEFEADKESRAEWADAFVQGLELLGMKHEQKTEPWEGACGVYSTILNEAAIRFQAETMSETFPAAGLVKTKIIGKDDKATRDAAERVRADMNHQLMDVMTEYRSEQERLLYSLSIGGSAFKKVYYDHRLRRQTAIFVPAEEVVVPYGASNVQNAERLTHIMRKTQNEVERLQDAGFYLDVDLGEPEPFRTDIDERKASIDGFTLNEDDRHTLLEMCVEIALSPFDEEDGQAKPYCITIDHSSGKVLSIYRNWDEEDENLLPKQHFVHYTYVQGFGFYGLGLIHIVGGYAEAGTLLIRQLVDAGSLSNLPGGLKTRDLRIKGDNTPIGPGEWKDVEVTSGTLKDNLMPLPYGEPSQTLLTLLDRITEEGRRMAAISDINVSDMSANAPVGTTLALLERTLKPMTAIQARVHYAMKLEFRMLKRIIADNMPGEYPYQPMTGSRLAKASDYALVDVIPVSDPNSSTMAQRITQWQAVHQLSQSAPQLYDLSKLHRRMIDVMGIKDAEEIIPLKEDSSPKDPISENMDIMVGTPVHAFIYQDHDAHIAAHMSLLQNPDIMAKMGQNPMAQSMQAAMQAHVAEHLAFKYRKDVEAKAGFTLPAPGTELPEQMEVELSQLVAQASSQLSGQKQKEAAMQQAQQKQQDPIIQMQMQEQARKDRQAQVDEIIKLRDADREDAKMRWEMMSDQEKMDLEREDLYLQYQIDSGEIADKNDLERKRLRQSAIKEVLAQYQQAQQQKMQQQAQQQQQAMQQAQQAGPQPPQPPQGRVIPNG